MPIISVAMLEPIDEALSTGAFLISLIIERTSWVVLVPIGWDSGQSQSAQGGNAFDKRTIEAKMASHCC